MHVRIPAAVPLLVALGLAACETDGGAGPGAAVPVVQTLLVAGETQQTAWVEWRTPADSEFTAAVRPVAPALVQLTLTPPAGPPVAFTPVAGVPGRFDAAVPVAAGGPYLLQGTVAGVAVSAQVTVPDPLAISVPAQDTISIAAAACLGFCMLPFRWVAPGATAYLFLQSATDTTQVLQAGSTPDTAGIIQVQRPRSLPDTTKLTVYALEPQAASFILPTTPQGSIAGVFGLFGAASRAERWIVWQ